VYFDLFFTCPYFSTSNIKSLGSPSSKRKKKEKKMFKVSIGIQGASSAFTCDIMRNQKFQSLKTAEVEARM